MTHTFDFNDDLTLDTGEFMAFDDIENDIVDSADDWLTSAESLGLQRQSGMTGAGNVVPLTTRKLKSG